MTQRLAGIVFVFLGVVFSQAVAQQPILKISPTDLQITVEQNRTAHISLILENTSPHEADDIVLECDLPVGLLMSTDPKKMDVLTPFSNGTMSLEIGASSNIASGQYPISCQLIYTYCIDVSCYQIVEQVDLVVTVNEEQDAQAITIPNPTEVKHGTGDMSSLYKWLLPSLGLVLIASILAFLKYRDPKSTLYLALLLSAIVAITYGTAINQHQQARGIASVLCTSCVGIEEARPEREISVSAETISVLKQLRGPIDLIVFYAPWCHSCPYAEKLVSQMATYTDTITYRFINVDEQPELATKYGVVRSNRTIVPAILRTSTEDVVFGVDNLESRILQLLGVTD